MKSVKLLLGRAMRKLILPLLPYKVRLPFRYWIHIFEGLSESELHNLHRVSKKFEVAIDVGANEGFYSYKMSKHFNKVYSFEINEDITHELKAYNPGNINIINKGLSSKKGDALLYIPILNGLLLTGWASLTPNNCPDTQQHIEKKVEICSLDSYCLSPVSFMKIDVEGHEVDVLEGAIETIKRNRPLILVEVRPHNFSKVASFFSDINYKEAFLKDIIGKTDLDENCLFVPSEVI